ncbi:MAG: AMP-binding protein, partial [Nocardioidaceae bacterium]
MTLQRTTTATAPPPEHPGIRPDSRLTPALAEEYTASGVWRHTTLHSLLTEAAGEHPDRVAAVDRSAGSPDVVRLTYAELHERAHRYACGLHALGVRPGDVVSVMLSNRADFAALIFAINEVGAIYSGIPAAYGEREVEVILRRTRARVVVVTERYGSNHPLDLVLRLRVGLPHLQHVVVPAADGGTATLESLLDAPEVGMPKVDARALCHLGSTSGTTGEPKGVMNTHQTL